MSDISETTTRASSNAQQRFDVILPGLDRSSAQIAMRLLRQHGFDHTGDLLVCAERSADDFKVDDFYDPASGEEVLPSGVKA